MDYTRSQIQKKLNYLSRSTRNFQWFATLLINNQIISSDVFVPLLEERDPVTRMKNLYLKLLENPLDLYDILQCLLQSRNEHLLPCFNVTGQLNIKPTSVKDKGKDSSPARGWFPKKQEQKLDDEQVFYTLIGRPKSLQQFFRLPTTCQYLTTIKLKYVSIDGPTFPNSLVKCTNLEFLELNKVKVYGKFGQGKINLPNLTEFHYNQLMDSNSLEESLEFLEEIGFNWSQFLFFQTKNSTKNNGWNLSQIFKERMNITVKIADRSILCVDNDKRKFVIHSNEVSFDELFSHFEAVSSDPMPFDCIALFGVSFSTANLKYKSFGHVSQLNLCKIDLQEQELNILLGNFPSLRRLAVTNSPKVNLSIDSIPIGIKSLALNIGRLKYLEERRNPMSPFELDSFTLYNTQLEQKVFEKFTKIFKCSRLGLGGDLNGSCLNQPIVQLLVTLLTTQYKHLDWLFVWGIFWAENDKLKERDKLLLEIIGIEFTAVESDGFLYEYEYSSKQLVGRNVEPEESLAFVNDLLGYNDFYSTN